MCIIVFKPAGKTLNKEYLRTCYQRNNDGAGYSFVRKGKMVVRKWFSSFDEFYEQLASDLATHNERSAFLLHFRIRTHGTVGQDNCHPFPVNGGVMAHNGSLSGTGAKYGEAKSDTALFIEALGQQLTYEAVAAKAIAIGKAVGSYNKLAFLFKNGKHIIVNEEQGVWDEGVWYSHSGYKAYSQHSSDWRGRRSLQ